MGSVMHARDDEHAHRAFRYPVYVAAIDLGELDALDRELRLFSHGGWNLFALHDRDYEGGAPGVAGAVADLLAANGLPPPHATRLVTHLRVAGYVFNPVSFFLNYGATGELTSVIAEVNNTYGGRRRYVLGPENRIGPQGPQTEPSGDRRSADRHRVGFRHVRELFVSPFLHGPAIYDFWFDAPLDGDRLAIAMHVTRPGSVQRIFVARLAGRRRPLRDRTLLAAAVRYPLMTAQVIGLIHLQALKLRMLGVPYLRPGPDHRPSPDPPVAQIRARSSGIPATDPSRRLRLPVGKALRRLALAQLRAGWDGGRLDVVLPSAERARIGPPGPPDARMQIHDDRALLRVVLRGEIGGGEAFVAGEWSSEDLVGVLRLVLRATGARGVESPLTRLAQLPALVRHRRAANTLHGSRRNVCAHYDLGNAFYQLFLDPETLAYSCAYFPRPAMSLADGQRAKLDRLCDLLALSPRDHLLEIGCGWGGMAIHAARTRGCRVTAITVSREQHELACARVAAAGLADRVGIQYRDYRELGDRPGSYDKLVSIEMIEAVGYEYLPRYFALASRVLRPGGRFALQSITMPDARFSAYRRRVDWMQTYMFPGSLIPSLGAIAGAAAPAGFRIARGRHRARLRRHAAALAGAAGRRAAGGGTARLRRAVRPHLAPVPGVQ
jgi:cyclopropane-fatty-acyl-phospholipid synthase